MQDVEGVGSKWELALADKEQWAEGKGEWLSLSEGAALEGTVRLAEDSGGEVHFVEHPGRGDRSVLVTPLAFVDGRTRSSCPFTVSEEAPPIRALTCRFRRA